MSEETRIIRSNILKHSSIIWTILQNTPTLDPLAILENAPVFILFKENSIAGFVSIKRFGKTMEIGDLYVYPAMRGKGYATELLSKVKKECPEIYLLCKPDIINFYTQRGFEVMNKPAGIIKLRKKLFDLFLAPFTGYNITVMKNIE